MVVCKDLGILAQSEVVEGKCLGHTLVVDNKVRTVEDNKASTVVDYTAGLVH